MRKEALPRDGTLWIASHRDCDLKISTPTLQEPIKDPARFPWHEVKKIDHYWLQVNAITKPMRIRENDASYGEES